MCIGMDVSEGMVGKYNAAALEQGLSENQMHAIHGDLMSPKVNPALLGPETSEFDLVTICMALHHLEDPADAAKKLVARLKKGGTFLVIDWATGAGQDQEELKRAQQGGELDDNGSTEQHHHHHHEHQRGHGHDHGVQRYPAAHTVTRDSFPKEEIEEIFKDAGCEQVDFVLHPKKWSVPMARGGEMQLFFARCTKV